MKYAIIICLAFTFNTFADFESYEAGCSYKGGKYPVGANIKIRMNLKDESNTRFMIWQCQSNQVRVSDREIFAMKVRWILIGFTE
jgi:hypothetical protein